MIQNIRKVIWLHRKRSASKLVDIESYARRVVIANIIYFTLKTCIEGKILYYTFLFLVYALKLHLIINSKMDSTYTALIKKKTVN